ncbi:hypothetical protein QQ020_15820 [Fulvivirgaceae bacterium BMA12]|uniref:Lipocalin-like domain-containing protein n=1 Tax=Agaribacillus aureus TaxID=3051825 RepID=A0ABT8L704_9BACT|nr:hypothetical protein [Fulvivirgaceae bacterium BMA12]
MKKLILILLVCAFSACSDDDEPAVADDLNGKWHLTNVTCECMPANLVAGDHTWDFDLSKKQLNVVNSVNKPLQILETGSYAFKIENDEITIQSVTYDYYFEKGQLFLADDPEVDGPLMTFERVN